jgi:phosphomannomutase
MQGNSIFRQYDVRGIYPNEINEEIAFKIGRATALHLKAKRLVVAKDGRSSSDALEAKVIEGITSTGCNVISIGQATTPLFYFSVSSLSADGGVMVTASHNPVKYNGFKFMDGHGQAIDQKNGLGELEQLMDTEPTPGLIGSVTEVDPVDDYVNMIIELSGVAKADLGRVRVVIDASNGVTSLVVNNLLKKINVSVVSMFFEVDGRFPNHGPDISRAENLELLQKKVLASGAALGVAFDGDGDRIAIVDNNGVIVWPDYILGLLFQYFGQPKTVYDLRISRSIKELIAGKGIVSSVGRSNIQRAMREHEAALGGELSGHILFKEMKYCESAVLAMLYILIILSRSEMLFSKLVEPLMKYAHSGEINIQVKNPEQTLQNIKDRYADGKLSELDGITVEYADWWFNLRVSNTEPLLRLVIEASDTELLDHKKKELLELINS